MRCNDPALLDFCQALSSRLLRDPGSRQFPDVMTFGYFCRKSISKVINTCTTVTAGLAGVVLHIAPANIPVNFAFSFLMGFSVRQHQLCPRTDNPYPQVDLIVAAIDDILADPDFATLRPRIKFFTCERDHPALVTHGWRGGGAGRLGW